MALELLLGLGCTQADPKKKFQPDGTTSDHITPILQAQNLRKNPTFANFWPFFAFFGGGWRHVFGCETVEFSQIGLKLFFGVRLGAPKPQQNFQGHPLPH